MREWNAATYHRISDPLFDLGMAVLARLELAGDETVLDLGCGTGRLTREVAARVPRGRVLGLDRSTNMVSMARTYLEQVAGAPIDLLLADALALPLRGSVDAVFSTATLHWVLDHPRLFANIHDALKPGGQFVAQCGGGPNIARLRQRVDAVMQEPVFAPARARFQFPWNFANAETTASRLEAAGFVDVKTYVESAPIVQRDADAFGEFIRNVVCGPYLAAMTDEAQRDLFVERLTAAAERDDPPFELDYWRLNMSARMP
jgi:trans-aconitate 2-methyltransferase